MLKHKWSEGSTNFWKVENNKVIVRENIHFRDIKGALQRSSNDEESCWKYSRELEAKEKALRMCFFEMKLN